MSKIELKFPKKTKNAINVKLSKLSRNNRVTLNAAAEIWGKSEGFSVWGLLDDKDKDSLKDKSFQVIKIKKSDNKGKPKKIVEFISYQTTDKFLNAHILEINRCYTFSCHTAAFILIRKVIENLLVHVIKRKFPGKSAKEKSIYLDLHKGRIHDLSILISNLKNETTSFDPEEKKLVLRLLQLSEEFKDDANDKTHSLFHISSKTELENKNPQMIFDLFIKYFEDFLND